MTRMSRTFCECECVCLVDVSVVDVCVSDAGGVPDVKPIKKWSRGS